MKTNSKGERVLSQLVKCRTCLGLTELRSSINITTERMLGKTIKDILLLFIPQLVMSSLVGDLICSNCARQVRNFTNFIESCIRSEKILIEEYIKNQRELAKGKANSSSDNIDSNLIHISIPSENGKNEVHSFRLQHSSMQYLLDPIDLSMDDSDTETSPTGLAKFQKQWETNSPSAESTERCMCSTCGKSFTSKDPTAVQCSKCHSDDKSVIIDVSDASVSIHSDDDSVLSDVIIEKDPIILIKDAKLPLTIKDVKSEARDTIISIVQQPDKIEDFIDEFSDVIKIVDHPRTKNTKNKRILFLGSSLMQCLKCKELLQNPKQLKSHFSFAHATSTVPELESDEDCDEAERNKRTFDCPFCDAKVATALLLVEHLRENHTIKNPFKCDKCGKEFKKRDQHAEHVKRFENSSDCVLRKCRYCPDMLSSAEYEEHVSGHKAIVCDQCGKSFLNRQGFKAHYTKHRNELEKIEKIKTEQSHLCPVCGKILSNPQSWKHHVAIHGKRSRDYICHQCPKTFLTPYSLKNHLTSAHVEKRYTCPICNIKVKTHAALMNHHNLKHSQTFSHICKICGKGFNRGDYFRRHMACHSASVNGERLPGKKKYNYSVKIESKPVKCKYCLKVFKNVYLLRTHLMSHVKSMRYKCKFCSMTFANTGTRFRHQKRHADPNFDLSCTVCWKRMENKEELEMHLARHEDSKKYECTQCDELFSSKYLLSHHMSAQHIPQEEVEKEKDIVLSLALEEFLL